MENKKSLRSSQMRSLAGMDMGTAIVNSLRPVSATVTQTPLDKILNNFYTDLTNQVDIVIKIYLMLEDANNKTRTTPLPSVTNYDDVENRGIVITYFLNDYAKDITSFLKLMDRLINTNWVIDTQRIDVPFYKDRFYYLTSTESYTSLLNKLVDFYDKNKNILKTDFFILDLN